MKALRKLIENADNGGMYNWTTCLDYFESDAWSRQLSKFTIKVNGERLALLAKWLDKELPAIKMSGAQGGCAKSCVGS